MLQKTKTTLLAFFLIFGMSLQYAYSTGITKAETGSDNPEVEIITCTPEADLEKFIREVSTNIVSHIDEVYIIFSECKDGGYEAKILKGKNPDQNMKELCSGSSDEFWDCAATTIRKNGCYLLEWNAEARAYTGKSCKK